MSQRSAPESIHAFGGASYGAVANNTVCLKIFTQGVVKDCCRFGGGERGRRILTGVRRRPQPLTDATFTASADFLLAAWFLWMTPLLTALSSLREAARAASVAFSTSPASTASRARRIAVFSSDLTALLRCRAFSLVLFRLIWDLMFAT